MENSRKNPKQSRAQETVKAILEAFTQLFSREGAQKTNTNRVAEKAGVSIGSLYQYFPNKEAILVAAIKKLSQERFDKLKIFSESLQGKSLEVAVEEMVDILVDLRLRDSAFEKTLIENLSHFKVISAVTAMQDKYIPLIADCLKILDTNTSPDQSLNAARFIYQTVFGTTVWVTYFEGAQLDPVKFKENLRKLLVGYIRQSSTRLD